MLPAGDDYSQTIESIAALLAPGDVILDGGNADYRDTLRLAASLAARGLHFIDVGVSGGIWGLQEGYGLMFGGPQAAVTPLLPVFRALAPASDAGWVHCGAVGSGHYTKMVHNGIEYGMMQAYAEGFALLQAKSEFALEVGSHSRGLEARYGDSLLAAGSGRRRIVAGSDDEPGVAGRCGFGRGPLDGSRGA